jgi:RNA binding exosome subunit
MPFIRKIEARAYARATEITESVVNAILGIFPEDIRQHVAISEERAEGQSGDSISIISALLKDVDGCNHTFDFILQNMEKRDRRSIKRSLDLRLDDNCIFFLRIDKQGAFLYRIRLANNADVIRTRFYIKKSPKCTKQDAMDFIEERLQETEV